MYSNDTFTYSAVSASSSYTLMFNVQNYDRCCIQFTWAGLDTTSSSLELLCGETEAGSMATLVSPMLLEISSGCFLFNIRDMSYNFIKLYCFAEETPAGSLQVEFTRKSER